MKSETKIYVVSAPSGTGKTTINRRLAKECSKVSISVSNTSRKRRPKEENGVHYWFVDKNTFQSFIDKQEMIEWVNVFGNLYGTSFEEIERIKALGHSCILEIDVQGWEQVKEKLPTAYSIFILPPSMEELWQRLKNRGTDDLAACWHRFTVARQELDLGLKYQYFVVNDELEPCYSQLKAFVDSETPLKLNRNEGKSRITTLIEEYESAPWIASLREKMAQNKKE